MICVCYSVCGCMRASELKDDIFRGSQNVVEFFMIFQRADDVSCPHEAKHVSALIPPIQPTQTDNQLLTGLCAAW
jgi:hypothetical protein